MIAPAVRSCSAKRGLKRGPLDIARIGTQQQAADAQVEDQAWRATQIVIEHRRKSLRMRGQPRDNMIA